MRIIRALRHRVVRFLIVGGGAAGLFAVLAYVFARSGVPPFLASAAAYLIAFAFAYVTQRSWTFEGEQSHAFAFPRYLALQIGCAILSGIVSCMAVEVYDASLVTMSLSAMLVTSAVSYVLSSRWVFARST